MSRSFIYCCCSALRGACWCTWCYFCTRFRRLKLYVIDGQETSMCEGIAFHRNSTAFCTTTRPYLDPQLRHNALQFPSLRALFRRNPAHTLVLVFLSPRIEQLYLGCHFAFALGVMFVRFSEFCQVCVFELGQNADLVTGCVCECV